MVLASYFPRDYREVPTFRRSSLCHLDDQKCSAGIRGNGRQGTGCACHRQNNNNCLLWLLVYLFKSRVSHVAGVTCDNPVISMCFSGPARPPCGIVLPHHWGSWIEQAVFAVESTNAWPDLRLHCHKSKSVTFWRCTGKAVESDAHHSNEKRSRRTAATAAATRRATATGTAASTNAVRNSWTASLGRRYFLFSLEQRHLKSKQYGLYQFYQDSKGIYRKYELLQVWGLLRENSCDLHVYRYASTVVRQVFNNLEMYTLTFTVWAKAGTESRATISYSEAAG